jgi:DNA-binding protein HU-beta
VYSSFQESGGLFVSIARQEWAEIQGRNPATGEAIKIPAKKVVKFRIAKVAKEAILPLKTNKAKA